MNHLPTVHPRSNTRPTPLRPTPTANAKAAAKPKAKGKPRARSAVSHRDATGHLEPIYAADLHAYSLASAEDHTVDRAFLRKSSLLQAPLADELGREAVLTMTTAEDQSDRLQDLTLALGQEVGGPFVVTTGVQEFARGCDRSNPPGATREPFPKT
jgi:hypothetical protein